MTTAAPDSRVPFCRGQCLATAFTYETPGADKRITQETRSFFHYFPGKWHVKASTPLNLAALGYLLSSAANSGSSSYARKSEAAPASPWCSAPSVATWLPRQRSRAGGMRSFRINSSADYLRVQPGCTSRVLSSLSGPRQCSPQPGHPVVTGTVSRPSRAGTIQRLRPGPGLRVCARWRRRARGPHCRR